MPIIESGGVNTIVIKISNMLRALLMEAENFPFKILKRIFFCLHMEFNTLCVNPKTS